MSSVTIKPGKYYIGNPTTIFPNWTNHVSCTYEHNGVFFHAFKFGSTYVAAIPLEIIPENVMYRPDEIVVKEIKPKKSRKTKMVIEDLVEMDQLSDEPEQVPEPTYTQKLPSIVANSICTFEKATLFYENNGVGAIGNIIL